MRCPTLARFPLIGIIFALTCASGCATMLRERVGRVRAGAPTTVPWRLNRELLMPAQGPIIFVVMLADGHEPERRALDAFTALAARYGERPARWVMAGSSEAPPLRVQGRRVFVDSLPDPQATYVVVRYGRCYAAGRAHAEIREGRRYYEIEIDQEFHRRFRAFLPEWRLEQQTLVHEYGHLLGLPPPDHAFYATGPHCVNPHCPLVTPRFRSLLYGLGHTLLGRQFLVDYCAECRRAIEEAKRFWLTNPALGGPGPDPATSAG